MVCSLLQVVKWENTISWTSKATQSLNRGKINAAFEVMWRNFQENKMLPDFINSNILSKKKAHLKLYKESGGKEEITGFFNCLEI